MGTAGLVGEQFLTNVVRTKITDFETNDRKLRLKTITLAKKISLKFQLYMLCY